MLGIKRLFLCSELISFYNHSAIIYLTDSTLLRSEAILLAFLVDIAALMYNLVEIHLPSPVDISLVGNLVECRSLHQKMIQNIQQLTL